MKNVFYRIILCDTGRCDFSYSTTPEIAEQFVREWCEELGKDGRDPKDPWSFSVSKEYLDIRDTTELMEDTDTVCYDWFGNRISEKCEKIGWVYGEDLQPRPRTPEDEDCPSCASALQYQINKYEEGYDARL